jgi:L-cysteine:1D-myo-inositol 2-amino-2-deoxy-alpha-D-glucopyranoside ligase
MRLYDTAKQDVVDFSPGPIVTMYTCGITPYDAAHVGFAAMVLTYDILQRRLRDLGHTTQCVRNVTDLDDSILGKARELGVNYLDLAAEEMARIDDNLKALGIIQPFSEPRATSAIPDILGFIGMVLESGHAYQAGGGVYFSVASFERFGQISHLPREKMLALAAERGGRPDDPHKRDPLDFVLWQHWRCASSVRRSTCMAVGGTWCSRTTSARPRSRRRRRASRSSATGCTRVWCASAARRCRSRSATWCS